MHSSRRHCATPTPGRAQARPTVHVMRADGTTQLRGHGLEGRECAGVHASHHCVRTTGAGQAGIGYRLGQRKAPDPPVALGISRAGRCLLCFACWSPNGGSRQCLLFPSVLAPWRPHSSSLSRSSMPRPASTRGAWRGEGEKGKRWRTILRSHCHLPVPAALPWHLELEELLHVGRAPPALERLCHSAVQLAQRAELVTRHLRTQGGGGEGQCQQLIRERRGCTWQGRLLARAVRVLQAATPALSPSR